MAVALHPNGVPKQNHYRWSSRRRCHRLFKGLKPVCIHIQRTSGVAAAKIGRCHLKSKRDTKQPSALHLVATVSPSVDFFEAAINSLVGGSAIICFALAFVPLLTYEGGKNIKYDNIDSVASDGREVHEPDDLETIKWSVASIVSFFPYLNWTSWLLVAFDSEPPLPYYFLSALYLMPFLKSGFDFNALSVFMFILGVLHIQVERVAQTEPAILGTAMGEGQQFPSILRQLSQSVGQQLPSVVSNYTLSSESSKENSISDMVKRELKEKETELKESEEIAQMEKQLWDQKFDEE